MSDALGHVVVLNGAPRAGKSSIIAAIQESFGGLWLNLGQDHYMRMLPPRYHPGTGLRPGGERPDLEPLVVRLYQALYRSLAEHSRLGINVVADMAHHDHYSRPLGILPACARLLEGLPAWLVGVHCPLAAILERRQATGYLSRESADGPVPEPVRRWQEAVHRPGIYDLEVDTSLLTPEECAGAIRERLQHGSAPTAFRRLAAMEAGEG